MLRFKQTKTAIPIGFVKNGKDGNKILYLDEANDKNISTVNVATNDIIDPCICPYCKKKFARKDNTLRHINTSCKMKMVKQMFNKCMYDLLGNGKEDDDNYSIDSIDSNDSIEEYDDIIGKEFNIKDNGTIIMLPNLKSRNTLYIAGPHGSGKSYYTAEYLKQYNKLFPKRDIIIFSRVEEDAAFDGVKNIRRIKLDDDIIDYPIDCKKELRSKHGSMVVFDDIDSIQDKKLLEAINKLRDDVLMSGRDQTDSGMNIDCICTNHQITDYQKTRNVLNESSHIVVFPKSGSSYGIQRALRLYGGLDKKQLDKILSIDSRAVCIHKRYPNYVIHEKGCYLLS